MTTLLITGANRGIGLEHVKQALAAGEAVIAACRAPQDAPELQELRSRHGPAALRLEALDVTSGESIDALAGRLEKVAIDVLLNNAGTYGIGGSWPAGARHQTLQDMNYDRWEEILRVNLLGPFRLTARLLPCVLAGTRKLVVMMSSDLGSIAANTVGESHAYRSSKAALNMITRGLSVELKGHGVTVISLAPGWTKTELGGDGAEWAVEDSVRAQRHVLSSLALTDTGQFINLTGEILPW